jgi:hypothetical protein
MKNTEETHGTKKIFGVLLPDWVDEEILKKLVYSFLGLMVAVLMSSLFIWPRFADLYKSEKELGRLEKSLGVLSSSVDQIERFEDDLGTSTIQMLELAAPRSFKPGLILSSLRQVSSNAGVAMVAYELDKGIVDIDQENTLDSKGKEMVKLKKHKVDLKLVGRSSNLVRFIDLVGQTLPVSVISELSLSEISKLFNDQGVSQLEMQITYFESRLAGVDVEKLVGFSEANMAMLEEVSLYLRPNLVENQPVNQVVGGGSLFGF